jgi:hypothetical protein
MFGYLSSLCTASPCDWGAAGRPQRVRLTNPTLHMQQRGIGSVDGNFQRANHNVWPLGSRSRKARFERFLTCIPFYEWGVVKRGRGNCGSRDLGLLGLQHTLPNAATTASRDRGMLAGMRQLATHSPWHPPELFFVGGSRSHCKGAWKDMPWLSLARLGEQIL